jgi:hypothetical protein
VKLTEIAQMKESRQLRDINNSLFQQQMNEQLEEIYNNKDQKETNNPGAPVRRKTRLFTSTEILFNQMNSQQEVSTEQEQGKILDVYDRLAIRGRIQADARLNFTPPQPRRESFSPSILQRSVKLAERRKSRLMMSTGSFDGNEGRRDVGRSLERRNSGNSASIASKSQQQQQQEQPGLKRSRSASILIDYNALPYRKEPSPPRQVTENDRKKMMNNRRHELERRASISMNAYQSNFSPSASPDSNLINEGGEDGWNVSSLHLLERKGDEETKEQQQQHPSHLQPKRSSSPSFSVQSQQQQPHQPQAVRRSSVVAGSVNGGGSVNGSVRTLNLTEAVKYDLEKSRSRSRSKQENQLKEKITQTFGHTKISNVK